MRHKFPSLWENPEMQGLNRLPMRSPLLPFASQAAALAYAVAGPEFQNPADSPFYLGLDGEWSFKLLNSPMENNHPSEDNSPTDEPGPECPPEWVKPEYTAGGWGTIRVPGT
jgi:beta-galactosidase